MQNSIKFYKNFFNYSINHCHTTFSRYSIALKVVEISKDHLIRKKHDSKLLNLRFTHLFVHGNWNVDARHGSCRIECSARRLFKHHKRLSWLFPAENKVMRIEEDSPPYVT